MKTLMVFLTVLILAQLGCVHSATAQTPTKIPPNATIPTTVKNCREDQERQKSRSEELQRIVTEDQKDRLARPIDWNIVYPRDVVRIKRVGEIFAEGCFVTGQDYAAAALVFQHGDSP